MAATSGDEQPSKKQRSGAAFSQDFTTTDTLDPSLTWKNPPASFALENGKGLKVCPKPHADFYRRTYRTPPMDWASGHALLYAIPDGTANCIAETTFTLDHKMQYDQAGLMVYIDDQHWIKTGIEIEGGVVNMSCVVTNLQSDWNYKEWPTAEGVKICVEIKWFKGFVECQVRHANQDGSGWSFLREAALEFPADGEVKVGVMCGAPKLEGKEGLEAFFKYLTVNCD